VLQDMVYLLVSCKHGSHLSGALWNGSYQGVLVIQQPPLLGIQGKPSFLERFSLLRKREPLTRDAKLGIKGGPCLGFSSLTSAVRSPNASSGWRRLCSPLPAHTASSAASSFLGWGQRRLRKRKLGKSEVAAAQQG
jgi:hypothetical protein